MSEDASKQKPLPAVPYLKLPEDGDPYLEGQKCTGCGAVFVRTQPVVCPNCGLRDGMEVVKLSNKGKLYAYSIIHRSFPGIDVPYISAVVDLEGGGSVKGLLINIEKDPEKLTFDMPVEVIYDDALGRKDSEGNSYISYFFQPEK